MPDKILHQIDSDLFLAVGLVVSGFISRILISTTPFRWKYFTGELIASVLVAIGVYFYSTAQGLSTGNMALVCIFMGLGITRTLEWTIKILAAVKNSMG